MAKATITPAVQSTIDAALPSLVPSGSTPEAYNESYLSAGPSDPKRILGAARGLLQIALSTSEAFISADQRAAVLSLLSELAAEGSSSSSSSGAGSVRDFAAALALARSPELGAGVEDVQGLRKRFEGKVPLAWDLRDQGERDARARELEAREHGEEAGQGQVLGKGEKADV